VPQRLVLLVRGRRRRGCGCGCGRVHGDRVK
jgi:hypothetical protein